MSLWEKLKKQVQLWQRKTVDEQTVIVTIRQNDQHYWDLKDVHYCIESYQSCQEITTACNLILSTWAPPNLPWKQSGNEYGTAPSPEKDLGFSFDPAEISCKDCITWMQDKLKRCVKCKAVSVYKYCRSCSIKWLEENKEQLPSNVKIAWDKKDLQKYPLCPNCWKTLILKFVIDGQNYYRCSGCGREDQ